MKTKSILILALSLIFISLNSCKEEEPIFNWEFTITTVTSISPEMEGYPMTAVTTATQNNLTEAEAETYAQSLETTVTQSQEIPMFGTFTLTVTSTCTKQKIE